VNTILVVDDRPAASYSMARPLAAAGFDVRETATGRDALRLARLHVDAIVLDIVLPDMDGFDVLRRLKADPETSDIPVILKTAASFDDGQRDLDWKPAPPPTSRTHSTGRHSSRPCAGRLETVRIRVQGLKGGSLILDVDW